MVYICEIGSKSVHKHHRHETIESRERTLHSQAEELIESIQADWDYCKDQDAYLQSQYMEIEKHRDMLDRDNGL